MRITIAGGRLVDPANNIDTVCDLHLANGHVVGLGHAPDGFTPQQRIDAAGQVVCPGLVDPCVRLREPGDEHKATIASEARAAVVGGITTLCCQPDTDPVVDTPAVAELIHQRAAQAGYARVEVIGALTRDLDGELLAEMGTLGQAGCVGVGNATRPVKSAEVMRRSLEYAATFGLTVFIQPEEPTLSRHGHIHEGVVSARLGLPGIPETAETAVLARDLLLAEQAGARVHFLHLSCARSVELVRQARSRGLAVSASATPHHLHLTEMDTAGFDSDYHVRPPLRTAGDRDRLREALADGTLTAVASDHQPHEQDAKLNPFTLTDPGISGLETLLPLVLDLVDAGVMPLADALERVTAGPARVLGIDRGRLEIGAVADVCVFDPAAEWTLTAAGLTSRGQNSPFLGSTLRGQVTHTLLDGRVVHARDQGVPPAAGDYGRRSA